MLEPFFFFIRNLELFFIFAFKLLCLKYNKNRYIFKIDVQKEWHGRKFSTDHASSMSVFSDHFHGIF